MKLLCELTPWQERTVERGRTAGSKIQCRRIIAADKWNWVVGTQYGGKSDAQVTEPQYYGSMRMLLPSLKHELQNNFKPAIDRIIGSLVKLTGKQAVLTFDGNPFEHPEPLGRWIDREFGTNYMVGHPPMVMRHLFGVSRDDTDDPYQE